MEDQKPSVPPAGSAPAPSPQAEPLPDLTHKKILVIDDDAGSQGLVRGILEKLGAVVVAAGDGATGLETTKKERPDVVILDVLMPGMDGFHYFKELKAAKETQDLPVLIMTVRKNMAESFLALGADGFVPKPVDTKVLIDLIGRLAARPRKSILDEKPPA